MKMLSMLFLHIVDDFILQGKLCEMKQKIWWDLQTNDTKYKHDYLMALAIHSFSWSFMIMLPIACGLGFDLTPLFYICFVVNMAIHATVDHLKANMFKLNLIQDQCVHLAQIIITHIIFR